MRPGEKGGRAVTREGYAAELAATRQERPGIRIVVYDHSFTDDRAWFRFSFVWPDPKTGEHCSRAGMQSYRVEGGKLAETSITLLSLGTTWTDAVAQERWTSKRSYLVLFVNYPIPPQASLDFTNQPITP